MRIAVLNYASHVGKSVLARHLLLPRIPDTNLLQIDPFRPLNSADMRDWVCTVLRPKDIVVDVPGWQTRALFICFARYARLHEWFDYFVIPTTAESGLTVRRTVATIVRLSDIGVPSKKIRVIFNAIDRNTNMSRAFSFLYRYWKEEASFVLNAAAVIHYSDIFRHLYETDLTFAQLMESRTALLELIIATEGADDNYARKTFNAVERMLPGVQAELDAVFPIVFE